MTKGFVKSKNLDELRFKVQRLLPESDLCEFGARERERDRNKLGSAKRRSPDCVNAARGQAEVVSKRRNKIHQTWGPPFSGAL